MKLNNHARPMALLLALVVLLCPLVAAAQAPAPGGEVTIVRGPNRDTEGFHMLMEQVREETGVDVNMVWMDGSAGTDLFVLMITGGETVDTTQSTPAKFISYMNEGLLLPLDDLLAEHGQNILARVNPDLWPWVTHTDGKIYGIPYEQVNYVTSVTVRQDWLDALGIAPPSTVQEYEDMLYAMKEAYDCAPLLIQLTNTGRNFENFLCGAFLEEGYTWWQNENGVYLPPEMNPGYKDMLATLTKWYRDGLISPDSINLRSNIKTLIEADKVGAVLDSWCCAQSYSIDAVNVVEGLKWLDLPALSGTYDNGNYAVTAASVINVVSVNAQNPAGVVKLIDWICESLENTIASRKGVRGYHWDFSDPDGELPTNWTDATNYFVDLGVTGDTQYIQGAFELLDINNFTEHGVYEDQNVYMQAAYDWWAKCYSWAFEYYTSLDDQLQIVPSALDCATQVNDCATALYEKVTAIITGADDLEGWDEWIHGEYQSIGMKTVIEEKNAVYAQKLEE